MLFHFIVLKQVKQAKLKSLDNGNRSMEQLDTDQKRGVSRGDQAYQFIVAGIQSGRLAPGTRLREIELAEMTGLSRTPVREALSRLQLEGLLTTDAARGLIVTELDYSMASELYAMREV